MSVPITINPMLSALTFVFEPTPDIAVFDYSCAADFSQLWSFQNIAAKRILLIWSHTAADSDLSPINAAECLSPVDWAVCFAAQKRAAPECWPEVMVLDVQSALHGAVPSVVHFNALKPDQLPWLRVETHIELDRILGWLGASAARDRARCTSALRQFLRRIRLDLTDVNGNTNYDRHAISNIIGPMILRGRVSNHTLHSAALLRLLDACDLVAADQAVRDGGVVDIDQPRLAGHETGICEGLQILLLDDQADHGWADWVRESLPGASVLATKDPTPLLRDVQQQLDDDGSRDLRYRLALPGLDEGKQQVLLLDLRLFSGNPEGERIFYKESLLPLVERFIDRDDLAWPCFSSSDARFLAALDAVKVGKLAIESAEYHEVLTWLPRVLAQVDLALPIILFSSTGRRSIERALASYRNVILGFEKPRFFDSHSKSAQFAMATESGLMRAIKDAEAVLIGRMRARDAMECLPCLVGQHEPARYGHFELFIDESGTASTLVVGGLVAGFKSLADAHEFDDRLVQAGVRYFPTLAGPAPPCQPLPKTATCRRQFESVVSAWRLEGRPLMLALVTLDGIEPFTAPLRFLDMDFMDNRWRLAVEAVVEVFLSQIVAPLQHEAGADRRTSVSIYGPTRVSHAASKSEAFMNQARFGTMAQRLDQYTPPAWGNHAVAESNLFFLVCDLLRSHCMDVDLEKAKFVRLKYVPEHSREWEVRGRGIACVVRDTKGFTGHPADDYRGQLTRAHGQLADWRSGLRSLHYVFDQVLRDMVWREDPWDVFSIELPTVHERYDKCLRGNLAASRFLDTGRLVEAIVAWTPHATPQPKWRAGSRKASDAVGARLARALSEIPGSAFIDASLRLRTSMRIATNVRLRSSVNPDGQPSEVPADPQSKEHDGTRSAPTRYFVRLDNLPNGVTPAGLLDVAKHASHVPMSCEIADDLEEGRRMAAIYFQNEESLTQVARALRRRGWQAKPFIASEDPATTHMVVGGGVENVVDQDASAAHSETIATKRAECRLRVGPIPNDLDLGKVVSQVRESYPRVRFIHHLRSERGSTKYLLEFAWPANAPTTLDNEFLTCGHEILPVDIVPADPGEW
jgi:hypothetical protein